jgi:prepilin-type N-terminal cleavage/methylation domain-containing protein
MKKNGFTIIELVIVIVLLGIVSAIAIPRFFNNDTYSSYFDRSEFESALSWTRNRAITTQCAHEFRTLTTGWLVLRDSDCQSTTQATGCAATEFLSFPYTSTADIVADGSNGPLSGTEITTSAANPIQRLIFTADGKLHLLTALPAPVAQGCTALSAGSRISNGTTITLNEITLTADGDTAYVAIQ